MKDEPSISTLANPNVPKETQEDGEVVITPKQTLRAEDYNRKVYERETGKDFCY